MSVKVARSDQISPVQSSSFSETAKLQDFWEMGDAQRRALLESAIIAAHTWHYDRNPAYHRTVSARGIGPQISPAEMAFTLRPTAQTFKSYIDLLATPFPQDAPGEFMVWLS